MGKVSVNLASRGLVLVTGFSQDEGGGNGSGKSSLANKAVLWTLFGETAGGLRADSVLNRHGKKTCIGKITFIGRDDSTYRIERKRPAKLSLFKGRDDISAQTAKETQGMINSLLGFDFDTFVQTSVFGQGRYNHYPSLTAKEQKAVLEQILPMEEADRWAEYADKQAKALKVTVSEVRAKVIAAESNLSTFQRVIAQSEQDGVMFETERASKIEYAKGQMAEARKQFQHEVDAVDQLEKRFEGRNVNSITAKMNTIILEVGTWKKYMRDAESKHNEAYASRRDWQLKIDSLRNERAIMNLDSTCPTCKRPYDEGAVDAIKARSQEIEVEILAASKTERACETALNHYYTETAKWGRHIMEGEGQAHICESEARQLDGLAQSREVIDNKIANAESASRARLEMAETEENPHVAVFERHKAEVAVAEGQVASATTKHTKLSEELDHLLYWKDVYGRELKLKLFEDACPFLDAQTQYHLAALKNQQIHCEFSTIKRLATGAIKEEFDVVVWSETGGRGFDSLSGGEAQMVSFAVGLALADLANRVGGSESGFLVLDEPFTELDDRNAEAVIEYLTAEIEKGRDTVMLISNEESLKGLIHNRIHVVKKDGISNVQTD